MEQKHTRCHAVRFQSSLPSLHPHSGIACVWLEAALLPRQSHRYSAPKTEREAWQVPAWPRGRVELGRAQDRAAPLPRVPNTARPRPHRQLPAALRDGITREGPRHSLGTFLVSSSAPLSSHADVSRQGWFQTLPHHEHTALPELGEKLLHRPLPSRPCPSRTSAWQQSNCSQVVLVDVPPAVPSHSSPQVPAVPPGPQPAPYSAGCLAARGSMSSAANTSPPIRVK